VTPRRVLITGASKGLGAALAQHHLDRGDLVIGCGRAAASIEHERYTHHRVDVADEAAVRGMFQEVRKRHGGLDALINNAGVASMNPVALTPLDSVRRMLDTNFVGVFLCTHAALRLLRGSPAGRIVNLTTIAVPLRLEGEAIYAATKSAVETFTRVTAKEVAPLGITCNAVGPSPVKTALTGNVPAAKMDALLARMAPPRWAEASDVINIVDFFLRPESGMVTGQVIYLGGAG
jgi:3-oxoacyl-[acyl-carrier protein] reductase